MASFSSLEAGGTRRLHDADRHASEALQERARHTPTGDASGRRGSAVVAPLQRGDLLAPGGAALVDRLGRRPKLNWKPLHGDRGEGATCIRSTTIKISNKTKNLVVPRQKNEPRRLITYLTYQMCPDVLR